MASSSLFSERDTPLEQFDEIFHAIERMNPNNSRSFFYTEPELELPSLSENETGDKGQKC